MVVFMNLFATSKVACCCWGMFWSLLALGCGTFWSPLDFLGSTSAWADGAQSDSDTFLKRVDFWHLSSGGAIVAGGYWEIGCRGHAMTVSVWLRFFDSGTLVVCNNLSQCTWPRHRTSSWWSKFSSSTSDDKIGYPVSSLESLLIYWSLSSSWFSQEIGHNSHP